jgi:hypothetical protein
LQKISVGTLEKNPEKKITKEAERAANAATKKYGAAAANRN